MFKCILLMAGIGIALLPTTASSETVRFHGQVLSTGGGELTLTAGGETMRFSMAVDATITLDDQTATLSDLTPDHIAKVTARMERDELIAVKVEAHSQKRLLVSDVAQERQTASEQQRTGPGAIEGTWEVVSFAAAGKPMEALQDDVVIFTEGRSIYRGKNRLDAAQYGVEPTATPMKIDLEMFPDEGESAHSAGIYRITGDTLTVCHGKPGAARPTSFSSNEDDGQTMVVLRRIERFAQD